MNIAVTPPLVNSERVIDRQSLLARCKELAHNDSILYRLGENMTKHGFAGAADIPMLVYLATLTRMTNHPVSAVIKGTSSSGKSFALTSALQYVPDHAYVEFHGLSEKALLYFKESDLKHKHLVIGEVAGLTDGNGRTFLRQLISEGRIRYATVQQTRNGHEGKELLIEGPMGALMTTTKDTMHWEDETRLLSLHTDESPEQTRRLLMAQAGGGPSKPSKEDLSQWHALHDYICSSGLGVVIPYDHVLMERIPVSEPRAIRDATQALALIRAHAFLHQCSREIKDGNIIAQVLDYYVVWGLIAEAFSQGLRASVPDHIRILVEVVLRYARKDGISLTEVANILGKDPSSVSRQANEAIKRGYLDNLNPGQGRTAQLVPGKIELPKGTALPDPQDIVEAGEFN
jgi:hypothetical protein